MTIATSALVLAASALLAQGTGGATPPAGTPVKPAKPASPAAPAKPNTLAPDEKAAGWILLFDGTDASRSFRGYKKESLPEGWTVVDGAITRTGGGGDIVTRDEWKDFEFVCDWKVAPGGNSGIMWHVGEELTYPWETGPEMQVLDDAKHPDGKSRLTSAGACYALYPAPEGAVKPAGEWNTARIRVQGGKVELWLNGVQTASFDTTSEEFKKRLAASKFATMPKFGTLASGRIALQDHGDQVSFRNLKIRPL